MKLLEKKFMVFCFALVLSCVAFVFNGNMASAMTLSDLEGTYRIVEADNIWSSGNKGCLVEISMTDKGLVGIQKNDIGFDAGAIIICDVWVDEGIIHCQVPFKPSGDRQDSVLKVYNNGNMLRAESNRNTGLFYVLKRM